MELTTVDLPTWREARRNPKLREAYSTVANDMVRRQPHAREFIAWDGEGHTDSDGAHHYMLFGASTGDSVSGYSLSTVECFELMLRVERENPHAYHVIFAGNYDVNMMLRDVDDRALTMLKKTGNAMWNGYRMEYRRSKWFRLGKGETTITLYDVFTFFACSFVKALEAYIGTDDSDVARIRTGKLRRADFGPQDIEEVRAYWNSELRYLVRLANTLRAYLRKAGITIHRWHGPGAVASTILKSKGFRHRDQPESVARAAQYAYAGGRFEQFKIGRYLGPVYQYDIRSAYPYAISKLPSLHNTWVDTKRVSEFGLYEIRTRNAGANSVPIGPLHWRHRSGAIFYPPEVTGTYWGIEIPHGATIHRGMALATAGGNHRPFGWIADYYYQRAEWKRNGEPAQLALKLAMNSIYGKLAQQIGWRIDDAGNLIIPTYHQLEYAGFITATTRRMLRDAMMLSPDNIIACETDAVFSTVPLPLNVGEGLGQWELTVYDGIMYVQSGVYWALKDGEWKARSRGFGRGDIHPSDVEEWLKRIGSATQAYYVNPLRVTQRRFKTIGTSIGKPNWRRWVEETRELHAGTPGGKREHHEAHCPQCPGSLYDGLHTMTVALGVDFSVPSTPYPLQWKEGLSEMQEGMLDISYDDVDEWEVYE